MNATVKPNAAARKDIVRLLILVAALGALGLLMVFSAGIAAGHGGSARALRQGQWLLLGGLVLAVAALVPPGWLCRCRWLILGGAVLLLVAVLVPGVGVHTRGARRWLSLGGGQRFQPSELAKLGLVVFLAGYFAVRPSRARTFLGGIVAPLAAAGLLFELIRREPDLGSAGLILAAAFLVMFLAGVRLWHLLLAGGSAAAVMLAVVLCYPHAVQRLETFLSPGADPQGQGYHLHQSLLSLGSGGVAGVGLGRGRHAFLPDSETDFILSVLGEELGLLGSLAVIALFVGILWLGARIAWRAPDRFGFLLAGGLVSLLTLQALINAGVVTGLLPTKGLCLPLVSYGGTSLTANLAAVGMIVAVGRRAARAPAAAPAGGEDRPALPCPVSS